MQAIYESPTERDALFRFLDDMKRSWGRMQTRVLMGPFGPFTMSRERADAVVADWRDFRKKNPGRAAGDHERGFERQFNLADANDGSNQS